MTTVEVNQPGEEWTCGKGLAAHAPLPASLGRLMDAVAAILEHHMQALDQSEDNGRQEHAAYERLAQEHRQAAALLLATGAAMADCHELPMGQHDEAVMASPAAVVAFRRFLAAEEELLGLLTQRLVGDRQMLAMMESAGS